MRRGRRASPSVGALAVLVTVSGCAAPTGRRSGPDPSLLVPQLIDPQTRYREMGMLASGDPLRFVGDFHFVATPDPDTTLVVFALSLANSALAFSRRDQDFEARYAVDLTLQQGHRIVARLDSHERVRVISHDEARRTDESIVFQKFLRLAPGAYDANAEVRDEQADASGHAHQRVQVPRLRRPGLSGAMAVYQGATRRTLDDVAPILLNPRATIPFGLDSLHVYVEAYGLAARGLVHVTLFPQDSGEVVQADTALTGTEHVASAVVTFAPEQVPVGNVRVEATVDGLVDTARTRVLVSFSDEWVITNFDEVLSLLRYFGHDAAVADMRAASPAERARLWRAFWRATDPSPATGENEGLEEYFRRLLEANRRFREAGEAGWLTDRGEVFVTLGEPDETYDAGSNLQGPVRIIRWNYLREGLSLDFVDDTGFGRFRMTPTSRVEYERVLKHVRSRS